jgi:hypothetical protein
MILTTYQFNFEHWLDNRLSQEEMDKYQEFLDNLYPYEQGSYSLYEMKIYYKGIYDCLSFYEPILHSEGDIIDHNFTYRLPLEVKDHAFNYFLKAELFSDPKYCGEIGRVSSIQILFFIEEEENNGY